MLLLFLLRVLLVLVFLLLIFRRFFVKGIHALLGTEKIVLAIVLQLERLVFLHLHAANAILCSGFCSGLLRLSLFL